MSQLTLHSYTAAGQTMSVDMVKFFQDAVMTNTVASSLGDAFEYCQATFTLTPLGSAVPKRDVSAVKTQLTKRSKVR